MEERLHVFLKKHRLKFVRKVSKGFAAEVFEAKNNRGKRFAVKIEHEKSTRQQMALKEFLFLQKANSVGVGPKLLDADFENRALLMEFVDGEPFGKWVLDEKTSGKKLRAAVKDLLRQARRLDGVGLDHGQLAGKGKNILVTSRGKPVIVDFEKASTNRRVHNRSQLESFLFRNPHGAVSKRVRKLLGSGAVREFCMQF